MNKNRTLLTAQLLLLSFSVLAITTCGGFSSTPPTIVIPHVSAELLYVGTNNLPSNAPQKILGFPIDLNTGALGAAISVPTANTATGLVADPAGKFLYATDEITGSIRGFSINPANAALAELAGSPFPGRPDGFPIFPSGILVTDRQGKFVYEVRGSLWGLTRSDTGALAPFGAPLSTGGFTASFDPTDRFVYSGECDSRFVLPVCLFTLNTATGNLTPVPMGFLASLDHVTVHDAAVDPGGSFVYASGVFDPSLPTQPPAPVEVVLSFAMDPNTGVLSPLPALITNLQPVADFTDIAVHPSGKFLFVNASSKIFAFTINAQGALSPVPGSPFPGKSTGPTGAGFRLDANGQFLYEEMIDLNFPPSPAASGIMGFHIDQNTGALTPLPGS